MTTETVTVEECLMAFIAVAATRTGADRDDAEVAIETIDTWRAIRPTVEALAAARGLDMAEPVGWGVASALMSEAAPFIEAEQEATR